MNATMTNTPIATGALQDMRAGVVEAEQDRERPAPSKAAPNTSAPIRSGADDGDDASPDDLAGRGRRGL